MKIHLLTPDESLRSLQSGPHGLSTTEARRRLREFGLNRVEQTRTDSLLWNFLKEFTHFFALILWLAAGMACWAEWHDPGQGMGALSVAIVGVIVVNGLFSFWQVYRAERALAALEKLLPHQVNVRRDGTFARLLAADLVPGDVISLEAGDLIPADCRLLEAFGVQVNTATVTGESVPTIRTADASTEDDLLHSRNIVLAGTTMVSGDAKAVVYATGGRTEFGQIAHLTQTAGEVSFPLQQQIVRLSRIVALLATGMGFLFFLIGLTIPLSFTQNFLFAVGIIVANVPEGLLPTVTLALAMGAQRMARRNVLIRHLPAVETLGSATVICTDKTGTLTENRMHVHQLSLGGVRYDVAKLFRDSEPRCGATRLRIQHRRFFEAICCCENLKVGLNGGTRALLGDPMEVALVEFAERVLPEQPDFPRVDVVPFDSDRRRLSTLHRTPDGLVLYSKGALEVLLPLCSHVDGPEGLVPMTPHWRERLLAEQNRMASDGLRVLAVAFREVADNPQHDQLEYNLTLLGLVGLHDPPRAEVPDAIRKCRAAGIRVIMITGDHPQTAAAIARQIGLVRSESPLVITGEQLRRLSNTQLQLALDASEVIFARIGADQKMRIVEVLQQKGEIVAVTGDGVNDAPALRQADIGIAMGVTGTDVARETADMVLADDNFASIVAAIEEGRAVFDNIRKFLTYILTSNIPEIVPYLAFVLFKIPLPLTIVQILAVDLGTDMLPALALGAEVPDPQVMQRPPRSRDTRLLNGPLLARAYLFLGVLEAVAAMAAFFFVLVPAGWRYGQMIGRHDPLFPIYREATAACLTAIVVTQIANVFVCRSDRQSVTAFGLFSNRLILWGIALELALIAFIDYSPWGNRLFETAPISWRVWLFTVPFAVAMLAVEETRKWFVRRINIPRSTEHSQRSST